MTREVSLLVNGIPVSLEYFVQGFIDQTVGGMLATLEGTGEIEDVNIAIEGNAVNISLNNAQVPLNPFVSKIIKNTIIGMLSSLKGVGEIKTLNMSIKR